MEQQQIKAEQNITKRSLCRFYVRGLCIYKKQECVFAHGICDLCYEKWKEGDIVETDYLQNTQFCQKKAKKGPRIYLNLYQFQPVKKYSLNQLNENRSLRVEVRNEMQNKMFLQFMELLQKEYPEANLTQEILLRQYTRVGFNKLMTRINFSHLNSALCDGQNSKYYKKSMVMPPRIKQQTSFIFKKAPYDQIIKFYRSEYQKIIDQQGGKVQQAVIKKKLYKVIYPHHGIPPANLIMKEKRINFTSFLSILNQSNYQQLMQKVKLEYSQQQLTNFCEIYLKEVGSDKLVNWKDCYDHLSKKYKINNANSLNQIKLLLTLRGYRFLFFPMIQFIYHPQFKFDFEGKSHVCSCQYQSLYQENIFSNFLQSSKAVHQNKTTQSLVIEIINYQTLIQWGGILLESKIIAIDLEGKLRKNGYIELIQINNGKYVFLLDIYQIEKNKDDKLLNLVKMMLRNLLANPNIVKVLHDCRHDSLALHQFMKTCIINILDTSTLQTYAYQKDMYDALQKIKNKQDRYSKAKNILSECMIVKTFGLNHILKIYKASHGQNRDKEKFHKMWAQGEVQYFCHRPMHEDYKEYCVKDVLDLPEVYQTISKQFLKQDISICKHISCHYVANGYLMSSSTGQKS